MWRCYKEKFLTPCRRIGLGKSPRSIKKSQHENLFSPIKGEKLLCESKLTVTDECVTPKSENISKFKGSHKINTITRSNETKRTLSVCTDFLNRKNINKDDEQLIISEQCSSVSKATESPVPVVLEPTFDCPHSEITDETLKQLALNIIEKQRQTRENGIQLIPTDLLTLKESIDVWRKAAQSALQYLLKINRERGLTITLSELIRIHGFDTELLQFLPEEDDFS